MPDPDVFEVSPSERAWMTWSGLIPLAVACLVTAPTLVAGSWELVALAAAMGTVWLFGVGWQLLTHAEWIRAFARGLEGRTLLGRTVAYAWEDLVLVESIPTMRAGRRLRLTTRGSKPRLVLTESLGRFDELEEALRRRAPHARWATRRGLALLVDE